VEKMNLSTLTICEKFDYIKKINSIKKELKKSNIFNNNILKNYDDFILNQIIKNEKTGEGKIFFINNKIENLDNNLNFELFLENNKLILKMLYSNYIITLEKLKLIEKLFSICEKYNK
jgi:hypothetical protein